MIEIIENKTGGRCAGCEKEGERVAAFTPDFTSFDRWTYVRLCDECAGELRDRLGEFERRQR